MLIISADDYGLSRPATDNAIASFKQGGITSASVMVFMEDSQRAAELAKEHRLDLGLHLNFTQRIVQPISDQSFLNHHNRIIQYLTSGKYHFSIYNLTLKKSFDYVFNAQLEEYQRLLGDAPTHFDGHHHMHLCANMIFGKVIPREQFVRRNFTFNPGDKSQLNRTYRLFIDRVLKRSYYIVDFLYSLSERLKLGRLNNDLMYAKDFNVELQTHPEQKIEFQWLTKGPGVHLANNYEIGNFPLLRNLSFGNSVKST